MEVVTRQFVAVESADIYKDRYGRIFVTIEFCRRAAMQAEPEGMDVDPLSSFVADAPSAQSVPSSPESGWMETGLDWTFDDETQTVSYGDAEIVFQGAMQYQLLKMAQQNPVCNVRDVWNRIWDAGWPEWRTVRACANQVNLKLARQKVPYTLSVKTDFVRFSENF